MKQRIAATALMLASSIMLAIPLVLLVSGEWLTLIVTYMMGYALWFGVYLAAKNDKKYAVYFVGMDDLVLLLLFLWPVFHFKIIADYWEGH